MVSAEWEPGGAFVMAGPAATTTQTLSAILTPFAPFGFLTTPEDELYGWSWDAFFPVPLPYLVGDVVYLILRFNSDGDYYEYYAYASEVGRESSCSLNLR